jgi:hypothetical protein
MASEPSHASCTKRSRAPNPNASVTLANCDRDLAWHTAARGAYRLLHEDRKRLHLTQIVCAPHDRRVRLRDIETSQPARGRNLVLHTAQRAEVRHNGRDPEHWEMCRQHGKLSIV